MGNFTCKLAGALQFLLLFALYFNPKINVMN